MNEFKTKPFKETLTYKALKGIYKEITKNQIPSDPQKVLEMEQRLIKEDELKQDVTEAKQHIKQILKDRRLAYKEVKRLRRMKIKLAVKMLVKILFRK